MSKNVKRRSIRPFILMGAGLLLIIVSIAWFIFSENVRQPVATSTTQLPADSLAGVERIDPQDAYAAHQQGQAVFVDVRGSDEYAQSHVAGAVSIPLLELADRVAELDPDDWIITY